MPKFRKGQNIKTQHEGAVLVSFMNEIKDGKELWWVEYSETHQYGSEIVTVKKLISGAKKKTKS